MLANCWAVRKVSFMIVGASAARIVRSKNESQGHAAIAMHGTHICHVTRSPAVNAPGVGLVLVTGIVFFQQACDLKQVLLYNLTLTEPPVEPVRLAFYSHHAKTLIGRVAARVSRNDDLVSDLQRLS